MSDVGEIKASDSQSVDGALTPLDEADPTLGGTTTIAYGERAGRVYAWILARILSTELAPGAFIDKTAVAAAIGVSKQPVTVALARLAREGWVEIEARVGSYVARLDPVALREVACLWFAALTLMAHDLVLHPDADLAAKLGPLRSEAAAALARDDLVAANAAQRQADLLLIERLGNCKARFYFELYRAHFGRYLRHIERSAALSSLAVEARRVIAADTLRLYDAVDVGDLVVVSEAIAAMEATHALYLERIASLG